MASNRFQMGQLILTAVLAVLLMVSLGSERGLTTVSAAETQAVTALAVPGGPGYVMVPAIAFQPESPTANYNVLWGELAVPSGSPGGLSRFNAPVYLPQGASLTGLTLFYRDSNSDAYTLGVDLYRKPLPSVSSGESVGLSVYSNQIGLYLSQSDTTPEPTRALIDNSQYAYWLSLYIYAAPTYLQLQAVRIDYGFNVALPLVKR